MGDLGGWAQPSGLVPNESVSIMTRVLDPERWSQAEKRTAELIDCIQPNPPSEERRNAVADYVQRLIMKCFSCQVFTFGSVPLKTYLPDGDIDLTAFCKNQNLKDTWANEVRDMLENEEKSENAEFRVKEVQYIQAEVKIIKCLVENIVVDISFNQLGGLCTLCFLEEVDHLINENHLFKRSVILIKAWCYYESRILGAHHGLISTYALETLVLYIFNVFNSNFAGPLEVLYRFLEFFSNFDWDNFCVSLWGPVPVSSLPDTTAEPPRKDGGELLLNKRFLDSCSSVYAVFPSGQENQGQPFVSKHFNVIDPLRTNNNLGRSVSKGNFFRIRSAFAFGAKRLARLLDCPKEILIDEVNQFFMNTWDRHGSGNRPDAPSSDLWRLRPSNADHMDVGSENQRNYSNSKKKNENLKSHESEANLVSTLHGISSQQSSRSSDSMSRTDNVSAVSHTQSQKSYGNLSNSRTSDPIAQTASGGETVHNDKGQRSSRANYLASEVQGRYQFARTHSSPELTDTAGAISTQGRHNRVSETVKNPISSVRQEYTSRRKKFNDEVSGSCGARFSGEDPSSLLHSSSRQSLDAAADSNSVSYSYHDEAGLGTMSDEFSSVAETMEMHQEEQDLVNMMASSRAPGFNGQVQMPMNLSSAHLPLHIPPSILASMGYAHRNLAGVVPTNIPLIEPPLGSNMQFAQGLVSSQLSHFFPNVGLAFNPEETVETSNENSGLPEMSQEDSDHGFWHDQDTSSSRGFDADDASFQMLPSDEKQESTSVGLNFIPSSQVSSSGSSARPQQKFLKENGGLIKEDNVDGFQHQHSRGSEMHSTDRNASLRFLHSPQDNASRSRQSSESSWDASSAKVSKSTREKRGRKTVPSAVPGTGNGKGKTGWRDEILSVDHVSGHLEDDNREWVPLSTMNSDIAERSAGSPSVTSPRVRNHQPSFESAQINRSDSMMPVAPVLVGPGSQQRAGDNSGMVPFAFYPTGPPVPFLTMLPVYNLPMETGNSDASTSHFDKEDMLDRSRVNQSDHNFDLVESLDHSEIFSSSYSMKSANIRGPSEEHKSDILNSDFASHWQNLLYGRFCQNPRFHGPLMYPSPVMVPPMYLQGHFPWDGPGRPPSANMNLFTQLMNYGPRLVPVAPPQPGSNRPAGVFQRYGDEVPRYRGGTGTYLPNPKVSFRDRQTSTSRTSRGSYSYDRNDHHGDREGNWNINSKPRATGRSHGRSQTEKPASKQDRLGGSDNRADRPWDSYRHDPFTTYQSQNGPFNTNSLHNGPNNAVCGMYPFQAVNSSGITPTGPAVPSVVMLYSYDHNVGYGSPAEQLEFGSLGPVHFSGVNDVAQLSEGPAKNVYDQQRLQGGSPAQSSPDQPSSPQLQRGG